ncbi:hypothetical protein AMTRI_Chr03g47610 [Amborella trichopoda]|uniref:RING-type domain-containing protein n=1 Tax=Amborella trichopoda TaxID=13333 RepID=W1P5X0_AMBTC|nr:probable BOI-related E3 ubiquitin-protein ligase 2 [Amborella trichopoda]ERN02360.1 hypothetical protein AMTR_s00096p00060800 [Amborella trichopoda]|eukprot:XP_006840685.1 probable BOI-related E3 ubiquitin-protein ligase 2 [Amborella trichopoda]
MFGGDNSNLVFPVLLGPSEENQFQYDSNAMTQLQLFGNFPVDCNVDQVNYGGNDHASAYNRPNKRGRESDAITRPQKLHMSLNNYHQDQADHSSNNPNSNAVSTGLRLSYDDEEPNSSVSSASGSMHALPLIASIGDSLKAEINRQRDEFEHYIRIQEENITKGVRELKQKHLSSLLSAVEKGIGRKLQEKELEIENMNRKNKELVERIRHVASEAQHWHSRARYNEAMVNTLKNNLEQAIAQGKDQCREGCGDSEVDDLASSCDQNAPLGIQTRTLLENRELKGQRTCRVCKNKEVSMLLLPCRHLCLCKDCEGFLDVCPVCRTLKTASVQVFMS